MSMRMPKEERNKVFKRHIEREIKSVNAQKSMKILVAPDKFKGSLTAMEVCHAIKKGIHEVMPNADIKLIPMADGGEGSLDVLINTHELDRITLTVRDPLFRPIESEYAMKGSDAYIEMAMASGLQLLKEEERSAMLTSSIGVGDLIRDALDNEAKNIYLFVGGSATNDGGIGMAHGLGFRFLDDTGVALTPIGANLSKIKRIENTNFLREFNLTIVTDVRNTLLGSEGATRQYGPQKGATPKEIDMLENGMQQLAALILNKSNVDVSTLTGSGAAGGIALCGVGLLAANIKNGMDTFLVINHFRNEMPDTDLIITGEGRMDAQTLQGKVVYGVAMAASEWEIPVVVVCGASELVLSQMNMQHVKRILELKTEELSVDYCLRNAANLIRLRIIDFMKQL